MKNKLSKLTVLFLSAIFSLSAFAGCTSDNSPGTANTNFSIPEFGENKAFRIFADRPPTPTEQYLIDYAAAGFTHLNMTEDDVRLTNADGVYGTADDGVINPAYIAALELCDELGLKAVIRNFYTDPTYFSNNSDEVRYYEPPFQSISYRVPVRNITTELTNLNAVDGYYMGDEPSWSKIDTLVPLVEWYNANGGNTFFHLNLLQSYGSFMFDGHNFDEYVAKYCDVILKNINGPKSLSTDYYPLEIDKKTGTVYIKDGYLYDYFVIAENVAKMNAEITGQNNKVLTNFCIQSYNANDKRVLSSVADIRFQANIAAAFGTKSLQYYLYRGISEDDGIVKQASQEKNPMWYWVKQTNEEMQNLANAILGFDWVGTSVYQGEQIKDETNAAAFKKVANKVVSGFEFISDVSCRLDTVVSEMQDKDNNKAYMVVNYSEPSKSQTGLVNLTFSKKVNKAVVYINGVRSVVDVKNNAMQIKLGAGEGGFVYPVYVR